MRSSDTILGAVTTGAVGSGIGVLINSPVLMATGTLASFGLAAFGWLIRKKEMEDAVAHRKMLADDIACVQVAIAEMQVSQARALASLVNVQTNQVLTADMMQRLHYTLHPETKDSTQPTVIQAPTEEKKA